MSVRAHWNHLGYGFSWGEDSYLLQYMCYLWRTGEDAYYGSHTSGSFVDNRRRCVVSFSFLVADEKNNVRLLLSCYILSLVFSIYLCVLVYLLPWHSFLSIHMEKLRKCQRTSYWISQKNTDMSVMILRYFNVIGSDPEGRLGEASRPELREHGRISGACFDAALGVIPGLKVKGTDYATADGTCIRDYIDVTDVVDAHVKALNKAKPGKVGIYNVGTGRGRSVKEFVDACKKATGVDIKIEYLSRRPGDYAEVYSDPTQGEPGSCMEVAKVASAWLRVELNIAC